MKIRTIVAVIGTAFAFAIAGPAPAHDGQAETVTPKFDQAISNIPGKSLVVLEVDYAPGAASPPHTHLCKTRPNRGPEADRGSGPIR